MNTRRQFLRTIPAIPLALAIEARRAAQPDDDTHHRDVLERFRQHVHPDTRLAGDGPAPSHLDVQRAFAHFALKEKP